MIGEKIDMKKRIVTYPAIFKPIAKDVYFISFPDVKGAITEGHGLADAFDMASDALATVLFDEKEFPKMTDPSKIRLMMKELLLLWYQLICQKQLLILKKQFAKM